MVQYTPPPPPSAEQAGEQETSTGTQTPTWHNNNASTQTTHIQQLGTSTGTQTTLGVNQLSATVASSASQTLTEAVCCSETQTEPAVPQQAAESNNLRQKFQGACSVHATGGMAAGQCIEYLLQLPPVGRRDALAVPRSQLLGEAEELQGCQRCRFVGHVLSAFMPEASSLQEAVPGTCNSSCSRSHSAMLDSSILVAQLMPLMAPKRLANLLQFAWRDSNYIHLSDSLVCDDKLLACFMQEALSCIQELDAEVCDCTKHQGCPGPSELDSTYQRLVQQRQDTLEKLQALGVLVNASPRDAPTTITAAEAELEGNEVRVYMGMLSRPSGISGTADGRLNVQESSTTPAIASNREAGYGVPVDLINAHTHVVDAVLAASDAPPPPANIPRQPASATLTSPSRLGLAADLRGSPTHGWTTTGAELAGEWQRAEATQGSNVQAAAATSSSLSSTARRRLATRLAAVELQDETYVRADSLINPEVGAALPLELQRKVQQLQRELSQIDQRQSRLRKAMEHSIIAGGRRLLVMLLKSCWSALIRHRYRTAGEQATASLLAGTLVPPSAQLLVNASCTPAQSAALAGRVQAEDECGAGEADGWDGTVLLQASCSPLRPAQRSAAPDALHASLRQSVLGDVCMSKACSLERQGQAQQLVALSQQLAHCQEAQAHLGAELSRVLDQLSAANRATEKAVNGAEKKLSLWQGDASGLKQLGAEELEQLAGQVEASLARIRAAHVQAVAERDQLCPVCWEQCKDMVFQCGHQTCVTCGEKLNQCPVCRSSISIRIKVYK